MSRVVEDFKGTDGLWVNRFTVDKVQYWTRAGQYFYSMHSRCKVGGSLQVKQPTYVGCTVGECFKDFQNFAEWCQWQVGYDQLDYQLDKDLLVTGNKVYTNSNCVFVPQELNKFLNTRKAARGMYKLGVSFHKRDLVFTAQVRVDGQLVHLGYFSDEDKAHVAYKQAKEAEARRWYQRLSAGEFVVDSRVTERMSTWVVGEAA